MLGGNDGMLSRGGQQSERQDCLCARWSELNTTEQHSLTSGRNYQPDIHTSELAESSRMRTPASVA